MGGAAGEEAEEAVGVVEVVEVGVWRQPVVVAGRGNRWVVAMVVALAVVVVVVCFAVIVVVAVAVNAVILPTSLPLCRRVMPHRHWQGTSVQGPVRWWNLWQWGASNYQWRCR